jgi:hypothetical protein
VWSDSYFLAIALEGGGTSVRTRHCVAIILAAIHLGGCAANREYWAQQHQLAVARIDAADDASCRAYGAQPGTPTYVNCRTSLRVAHENAAAADETAAAIRDSQPVVINQR